MRLKWKSREYKGVQAEVGKGVFVVDYGELEYLDGAAMQYMVTFKKRGDQWDCCAAYFSDKDDAILFARAKAGLLTEAKA